MVCPSTILEIVSILGLSARDLLSDNLAVVHRLKLFITRSVLDELCLDSMFPHYIALCQGLNPEIHQSVVSDLDVSITTTRDPRSCGRCVVNEPEGFCEACVDFFCIPCFSELHKKGARSSHRLRGNDGAVGSNDSVEPGTTPLSQKQESGISPLSRSESTPETRLLDELPGGRGHVDRWVPFYDQFGRVYFFNFRTTEIYRGRLRDDSPGEGTPAQHDDTIPSEMCDVYWRMQQFNS